MCHASVPLVPWTGTDTRVGLQHSAAKAAVRPGPREMLRISEMTCRLPHGRLIVDRLNLVLEKGQNMVVQGPSGSGSPSLLLLLLLLPLLLLLLVLRLRLRLRLLLKGRLSAEATPFVVAAVCSSSTDAWHSTCKLTAALHRLQARRHSSASYAACGT